MACRRILLNILSHFTQYLGGLGPFVSYATTCARSGIHNQGRRGKQSPNDQDLVQGSWAVGLLVRGEEGGMPIVAGLLGSRQ